MICPHCESVLIEEYQEFSDITLFKCPNTNKLYFADTIKYGSLLPYGALEEAIAIMENSYNDLTSGGMPDQHGFCDYYSRILTFFKELKKLYFECTCCRRMVAPDEPSYTDSHEDSYCKNCWEEGI